METSEPKATHYLWLDWLRFLAAFAVLVCHGRGFFLPEYAEIPIEQRNMFIFIFYSLTRLANDPVVIFFVLSGFLVGGKGLARISQGTFNCRSYFIDRFARIFPPLLGCTIFYCIAAQFYQEYPVNYWHCLGNLLSLQNIFCPTPVEPFWSLAYEVWFYILLGTIGVFVTTSNSKIKVATLIILGGICWILTKLDIQYMFILFLGIGAYFIEIKNRPIWKFFLIFGLFLFAIAANQIGAASNAFQGLAVIPVVISRIILGLTVCFLIIWLAGSSSKNKYLLWINRLGSKLAAFSYTLYLSHVITFRLLQHLGWKRATQFNFYTCMDYILCIVISMIVAYLLYLCFEKNTPWLKNKLKQILISKQV